MSQFTMRIDPQLKKKTQENLNKMGLDMSTATKMFFTFINQHGYLPFTPSTGKTELDAAIEDANNHEFSSIYNSFEDYKEHLINESKFAINCAQAYAITKKANHKDQLTTSVIRVTLGVNEGIRQLLFLFYQREGQIFQRFNFSSS